MRAVSVLGVFLIALSSIYCLKFLESRIDVNFKSPFDEHSHFDYWWKIYDQKKFPERYDRLSNNSIQIWNCRPAKINSRTITNCDIETDGLSNQENTASPYLPTFYLASASTAWAIEALKEFDDKFELAKVTNLAWGYLVIAALIFVLRSNKTPDTLIAFCIILVCTTPAFIFGATTFNQEIFVLLLTLITIFTLIKDHSKNLSLSVFIIKYGLISFLCLSIKPTALLAPVIIATTELLNGNHPLKDRFFRIFTLTIYTIISYGLIIYFYNILRGTNPTDGVMLNYMLSVDQPQKSLWDYASMTYNYWLISHGSYGWRHIIDPSMPQFFHYFHNLIFTTAGLSIFIYLICKGSGIVFPISGKIFIGTIVASFALPITLATYLAFTNVPYFFQPRYYTAYIITSTIFALAFAWDSFRIIIKRQPK